MLSSSPEGLRRLQKQEGIMTSFRKSIASALAATILATGVIAAPTGASAKPYHGKHYGKYHGGHWGYHHRRRHWSPGLVGVGLGLGVLGAAAAASAAYAGECYMVRRRAVDEDGNMYIRRVQVCD